MKKFLLLVLLLFFSITTLNGGYLGNKAKKSIIGKTTSSLIKKKTTQKVAKNIGSKAKDVLLQNEKKKIFKKSEIKNPYAPNGTRTVYQRNIDSNYKHTDKYGNTVSNQERMEKGQAPYELNKTSGKSEQIQLHHSQQKNNGSLFELKESTHLGKNSTNGDKALHPYGNNKNPNNPVDRESFNKERKEYWIQRAKNLKGNMNE